MKKRCIVWLRNDLRLEDHSALAAAASAGYEIQLVYIYQHEVSSLGLASQWWLHHALKDLEAQVRELGGSLLIAESEQPLEVFEQVIQDTSADAVYWNRRYDPHGIKCDKAIKARLLSDGIEAKSFCGNVLNEPQNIKNKAGRPFQVFTPYWKSCRELPLEVVEVGELALLSSDSHCSVESLALLPKIGWDKEFYQCWEPTREGGLKKLKELEGKKAKEYSLHRDIPSVDGTSTLAAWLHFGQVSAREIACRLSGGGKEVDEGIVRQLYWRDFAHHLMYHFPHSTHDCLRKEYEIFPWQADDKFIERWQKGETGYPIVDAGMRQLWQTGWMHNRVRMIVASFLVKHLLQDWRVGMEWFADTLLDADIANNAMGWQWCTGCGADAAPYFRIFNPVSQGQRFDPQGDYVRRWIPELAGLPDKYIHQPWEMGELELLASGLTLGVEYPRPLIELKAGRERALVAFRQFKEMREML